MTGIVIFTPGRPSREIVRVGFTAVALKIYCQRPPRVAAQPKAMAR